MGKCEYRKAMTLHIHGKHTLRGFSLIELLAVLAVVIIMMSMLLPAISGFGGSTARKGAVTTVMNTLEQARVAALESGRNVMVVFARPNFPERDALVVLREPEDAAADYEALTRWIRLPEKVLLHEPVQGQSVFSANVESVLEEERIPVAKPPNTTKDLAVLIFNSSGAVEFPVGRTQRNIRISEGVRGENGQEALTIRGFDMVSVARFTGRTQLDIALE